MRWLLRCKYNHMIVLFLSPLFGRWMSIDITKEGVQIVPASKSFERIEEIECWKYRRSFVNGIQATSNLIGAKYDWLGLSINIIRLFLWRLFGLKWERPLHDVTRYMCFEFGITMLKLSGISSALHMDASVTPPEDLRQYLIHNGGFEVVACPVEGS